MAAEGASIIYRHQAKLAVGIADGIVSIGSMKLYLCQ
jgi:hypothetical protein